MMVWAVDARAGGLFSERRMDEARVVGSWSGGRWLAYLESPTSWRRAQRVMRVGS